MQQPLSVIPVYIPSDGSTTPPVRPGSTRTPATIEQVNKLLQSKGWPTGLRNALLLSVANSPTRYIICDSSGSMATPDGHRISGEGASSK